MKHIKLFENFENFDEFKSEVDHRRSKSDNWSMFNIDGLLNDSNSIRMFMKEGSVVEILNLLNHIIKNGLEDKKIKDFSSGYSKPRETVLYYYLLYLINLNRLDVLDKIDTDRISGKLSEEQKNNISIWLEKSRKVDNKEPFQEFLDTI
jgi:hypothetical protein